jgi:hypothetical protein
MGVSGLTPFLQKNLSVIHFPYLFILIKSLPDSPEVIKKLPDRLRSFRGKTIVMYVPSP